MVTTSTYLDHASATPLDERARAALLAALDEFGDPLRVHGDGLAARRLLDDARADGRRRRSAPSPTRSCSRAAGPNRWRSRSGAASARSASSAPASSPRRSSTPRWAACSTRSRPTGSRSVLVPVDGNGSVDLDAFAARDPPPGDAPRVGAPREPRGRDDPADRRRRPSVPRGRRAVPHRRLPDRRPPARRRAGARGRPALDLGAQVRRAAGDRGALRPARRADRRVPLRRRPRAATSFGRGERPGRRRDGRGARGSPGGHGRRGGPGVGAHRHAPRRHRRTRARAPGSTVTPPSGSRTSCASRSRTSTPRS